MLIIYKNRMKNEILIEYTRLIFILPRKKIPKTMNIAATIKSVMAIASESKKS